jgi:hypothetical protein
LTQGDFGKGLGEFQLRYNQVFSFNLEVTGESLNGKTARRGRNMESGEIRGETKKNLKIRQKPGQFFLSWFDFLLKRENLVTWGEQ